jgi:hypothetical protein
MTPKKLGRRIFKALTTLVAIWGALQLIAWKMSTGDEGSNHFNRIAIFGGNEFTSVAAALESGRVNVVLGGIAIDLTGAQLGSDGADLSIDGKLAGVALAVPATWRVVIVEQQTIAGDIAIDVTDPLELPDDSPVLRVTAHTMLGGVAISTP